MKTRLFTPGPTELHPRVQEALARPILNHRKPVFQGIMKETGELLRALLMTRNPVVLLSSSGTGVMEACARHAVRPGEEAIVVSAGKFGERWEQILEKLGVTARVLKKDYGKTFAASEMEELLKANPKVKAVFCQHSETSTGTAHPIDQLSPLRDKHAPQALLVIDAITSVGCMPLEPDAWGLDMVIGGSQKALMCPPGLGFVALSDRAVERMEQNPSASFYLDLNKELESQKAGNGAFTPAVNLVCGLKEALDVILGVGLETWIKRTQVRAWATRTAFQTLGLELLSESPSSACTAVLIPEKPGAAALLKHLEKNYGILAAGGQGSLKGKICRFAHLGNYNELDTLGLIACVEMGLVDLGHDLPLGTGVAAAQMMLRETS